jgi:trk system potassium uptake protein TrkH
MNWGYVGYVIGALTMCVGMCMAAPLGFALYYGDAGLLPLLEAMLITVASGGVLFWVFRRQKAHIVLGHRAGMAITALGWAAAGLFGALPFLLAGTFPSVVDCIFESFSGFTTTGASVLSDIEAVPRSLLFWRSLTHWLGGMGIIVLSLAILPFLGVGGMQLYRAEVPGPVPDKLKPRIRDTAMLLWKVYLLFSAVQTVLLMLGGMDLFDALCHTFGTMATGGFSTRNASIAAYDSVYIHLVIIAFMFAAGINFALHFLLLAGKPRVLLRDSEFKVYAGFIVLFTIVITIATWTSVYDEPGRALLDSTFQVVSIMTTTGYATADYEQWPYLCQALLLFCMFVGGSAGSTGGGMKVMRIVLLVKTAYQELLRLIHPRVVSHVKFGRKVVPPETLSSIWGFFILWLSLFFVTTFIVAASGVDVLTSFGAALACIGNIGPGIGLVGPTDNYAGMPELAKWVLVFCMVLGRLEIYTIIVLLVPEFWRK